MAILSIPYAPASDPTIYEAIPVDDLIASSTGVMGSDVVMASAAAQTAQTSTMQPHHVWMWIYVLIALYLIFRK